MKNTNSYNFGVSLYDLNSRTTTNWLWSNNNRVLEHNIKSQKNVLNGSKEMLSVKR